MSFYLFILKPHGYFQKHMVIFKTTWLFSKAHGYFQLFQKQLIEENILFEWKKNK